MGKYMRKAKLCGEVAVMEVPHQTPLGVRTRARTLALQRLLKTSSSPSPSPSPPPPRSASPSSSPDYLELRSRRLEKPPPPPPRDACERRGGGGGGAKPAAPARRRVASAVAETVEEESPAADADAGAEASSLGENAPEADSRDRNVRETTPCSLIRDSETISTPGSTTRTNSTATNRQVRSSVRRDIPTALEMEEFFTAAERIQQQIFSERYNFDPVNERPFPGRYEWVKLDY